METKDKKVAVEATKNVELTFDAKETAKTTDVKESVKAVVKKEPQQVEVKSESQVVNATSETSSFTVKDYEELLKIPVDHLTEIAGPLHFLNWGAALHIMQKHDPNFEYKVKHFENDYPYFYDERFGIMVETSMRYKGIVKTQTHYVREGQEAMFAYEKDITVNKWDQNTNSWTKQTAKLRAATVADVNKTIQRCLVKNCAQYGLGATLYMKLWRNPYVTKESLLEAIKECPETPSLNALGTIYSDFMQDAEIIEAGKKRRAELGAMPNINEIKKILSTRTNAIAKGTY